jgi:molybdate transport system substrate-binding protein
MRRFVFVPDMLQWTYRAPFVLALILAGVLLVSGCDDDEDGEGSGDGETPQVTQESTAGQSSLSGDLTVFAASSLTDAFTEIGDAFSTANPDASVEFNFAGSPALRTQLAEGAAADVLATADQTNMDTALQDGLVVDPGTVFARNRLAVIVPADNPAGIESPFDLDEDGIRLVLAGEDVPVGNYARQSLDLMEADPQDGAGFSDAVLENLVSEEPNVKAVVTKVQLGEADAGIVYVTDVTPDVASDITLIEIPDAVNVIAQYPIAVTADAGAAGLAQAFIDFVLSDAGQSILQEYGFLPP